MNRHPSLRVPQRNEGLLQRLRALTAEPPVWGYRRSWAYLRLVDQLPGNKKRLVRVRRAPHLLGTPTLRLRAQRTPRRSPPKPPQPNEGWGIAMTQVLVEGGGWSYILVVLDWYPKRSVGSHAGMPCKAQPWLAALAMAVNQQCPTGVRGPGLALMSDNGGQATSTAFMRACGSLGSQQALTRENTPKGNADPERVRRTRKAECLGLQAWTCSFTLARVLKTWLDDDHEHSLHSALGYKPPRQFERDYHLSHGTQLPAA